MVFQRLCGTLVVSLHPRGAHRVGKRLEDLPLSDGKVVSPKQIEYFIGHYIDACDAIHRFDLLNMPKFFCRNKCYILREAQQSAQASDICDD